MQVADCYVLVHVLKSGVKDQPSSQTHSFKLNIFKWTSDKVRQCAIKVKFGTTCLKK